MADRELLSREELLACLPWRTAAGRKAEFEKLYKSALIVASSTGSSPGQMRACHDQLRLFLARRVSVLYGKPADELLAELPEFRAPGDL